MPKLKLYTVAQVREWLEHNHSAEGLSEQVIAPTRAWAIIHNPYVKEDDPIVAAIFEKNVVAAYTAAFPEEFGDKRIWWFTTLWCNPNFQGNGYGMIVIGSLAEVYGENCAWDRSGVPETVEIFTHLGNQRVYTPRYIFSDNDIRLNTFVGKLALIRQKCKKYYNRKCHRPISTEYELRYVNHIDDGTYEFIKTHRKDDFFLHSKEMLNWELHYPFMISSPLMGRVQTNMEFHSYRERYTYYAIQVWKNENIIGFYILRLMNDKLSIVYCFYDEAHTNEVFASIVEHIDRISVKEFDTDLQKLADYISANYYFPKHYRRNVSFSPAGNVKIPNVLHMQLGDGDCFA